MEKLFAFVKTIVIEMLPEIISVLVISAVGFLIFLVISYQTKDLIRKFRPIWYLQSALLFSVVIAAKSIAYSSFGLDAGGLDLVDKASQTLLWLLGTSSCGKVFFCANINQLHQPY